MKIAGTITAVTKQMNLTRRAAEIALAVAMQESTLDPTAVNGPWVGLFQQAPDPVSGLYTQYDRTDPAGATRMFLEQLVRRVPGYDTDPRQNWELGEVVQESHVGQNVAKWQDMGKALAAVLYSGTPPPQVNTTCSTDTTGAPTEFDPGNIISDTVFYNDSSFPDVAAVQAALDRIGAACTAPTCLRLDTYTPGAYHLDWCKDWAGPPGPQSYASILFHLGKSCGINPQVAIVIVQKESQGLTRPNPPAALTGFGCPDTGPGGTANCDSGSAGVWAQTFGMFQAFARLHVDPSRVNYPEGKTSNILWNVAETGCGSAPVTVQNRATATLYTYTPYQPNAGQPRRLPRRRRRLQLLRQPQLLPPVHRVLRLHRRRQTHRRSPSPRTARTSPSPTTPTSPQPWPAKPSKPPTPPSRRASPPGSPSSACPTCGAAAAAAPAPTTDAAAAAATTTPAAPRSASTAPVSPPTSWPKQASTPRTTPAPNEPAASPSPGTKASPATSSASPATSRSTSAPSTASGTSSKRPGSAHPSTSSHSPAPTTTTNSTATGQPQTPREPLRGFPRSSPAGRPGGVATARVTGPQPCA